MRPQAALNRWGCQPRFLALAVVDHHIDLLGRYEFNLTQAYPLRALVRCVSRRVDHYHVPGVTIPGKILWGRVVGLLVLHQSPPQRRGFASPPFLTKCGWSI
jgi:hypothetical protein